jgi:hypothetical protein
VADRARESSAAVVVSTEDGSVDGVKLQLQASNLADFSLDKPGASSVRLAVEDEQGVVVEQAQMSMNDRGARRGVYLVPGRYTASAIQGGQVVALSKFVMGAKPLKIVLTSQ